MSLSKWSVLGSIALTLLASAFFPPLLPSLIAERHCPGNVPSVPLRLVERTQILVSVEVNHHGPYEFLVDTGAQVTVLDTDLARELHLDLGGTTGVVGVGTRSTASWTRVTTLQTGTYSTPDAVVLVQNLTHLRALDDHVRGILGGNFLSQFNLFIDYEHGLLCLDSTESMGHSLKGSRAAFVEVSHAPEEAVLSTPPLIRAFIAGGSGHELLFLLDSGSNVPILYNAEHLRARGAEKNFAAVASGIDGMEHGFAGLPTNNLTIAGKSVREILFSTPRATADDVPQVTFDGLLPTSLFKRIYISYSGRYAMIDPR